MLDRARKLALAGILLAGCSGVPDNAAVTPVGAVQGRGPASPLVGQLVTIEGVVTGDFQSGDADPSSDLSGFFVTGDSDGDPATSDGIFVYERVGGVDVAESDRVRVTGEVTEFYGETQLAASGIEILGRSRAEPVTLPSIDGIAHNSDGYAIPDLERFEGMLVRFDEPLTVSENYGLDRYGELMLTTHGRIIAFTNENPPSKDGYAQYLDELGRRSIVLDDGRRDADVRPVRFLDADMPIRVGDEVANLTGVLRYSRGAGASGPETWRLIPTQAPEFTPKNPRVAAPVADGNLSVASFNVLNLFTTVDNGEKACGPRLDGYCRGADNDAEYTRQLEKICSALIAIDADIVGLVELENNERASLDALIDALAARDLDYRYIDTGPIGGDAIKVGLIYKPASVMPVGKHAVLDASVDPRFNDRKNRPVLAQTFEVVDGGARLTVAVNHLKSKGSDCDELGDPDLGDGAGNCNRTRADAARAMADWLATDPTGSGDDDVLIVGDLNAHFMEDPAQALVGQGYVNLVERFHGQRSYTYVFRGQSGALDHVFASPSLAPQVVGASGWAINADESRLLDYNIEGQRDAAWFAGDEPFRSSDHDPLLVGLELTP